MQVVDAMQGEALNDSKAAKDIKISRDCSSTFVTAASTTFTDPAGQPSGESTGGYNHSLNPKSSMVDIPYMESISRNKAKSTRLESMPDFSNNDTTEAKTIDAHRSQAPKFNVTLELPVYSGETASITNNVTTEAKTIDPHRSQAPKLNVTLELPAYSGETASITSSTSSMYKNDRELDQINEARHVSFPQSQAPKNNGRSLLSKPPLAPRNTSSKSKSWVPKRDSPESEFFRASQVIEVHSEDEESANDSLASSTGTRSHQEVNQTKEIQRDYSQRCQAQENSINVFPSKCFSLSSLLKDDEKSLSSYSHYSRGPSTDTSSGKEQDIVKSLMNSGNFFRDFGGDSGSVFSSDSSKDMRKRVGEIFLLPSDIGGASGSTTGTDDDSYELTRDSYELTRSIVHLGPMISFDEASKKNEVNDDKCDELPQSTVNSDPILSEMDQVNVRPSSPAPSTITMSSSTASSHDSGVRIGQVLQLCQKSVKASLDMPKEDSHDFAHDDMLLMALQPFEGKSNEGNGDRLNNQVTRSIVSNDTETKIMVPSFIPRDTLTRHNSFSHDSHSKSSITPIMANCEASQLASVQPEVAVEDLMDSEKVSEDSFAITQSELKPTEIAKITNNGEDINIKDTDDDYDDYEEVHVPEVIPSNEISSNETSSDEASTDDDNTFHELTRSIMHLGPAILEPDEKSEYTVMTTSRIFKDDIQSQKLIFDESQRLSPVEECDVIIEEGSVTEAKNVHDVTYDEESNMLQKDAIKPQSNEEEKEKKKKLLCRSKKICLLLFVALGIVVAIAIGASMDPWEEKEENTPPTSDPETMPPIVKPTDGSSDKPLTINGTADMLQAGTSVSISDDGYRIAVGGNGIGSSNIKMFEFVKSGSEIVPKNYTIHDNKNYTLFAYSHSLSGDGYRIAIASIQNEDDEDHTIEVYEYNPTMGWNQLGNGPILIRPNDYSDEHDRNVSLSLSRNGTHLVIGGAPSDKRSSGRGYVSVYEYNNSDWVMLGRVLESSESGDCFGESVSISANGSRVAIGAHLSNSYGELSGQVIIYQYSNSSNSSDWEILGQTIDGDNNYDKSGETISLSDEGDVVAIGSPSASINSIPENGQVKIYAYDPYEEMWKKRGSAFIGGSEGSRLGSCVSLSGNGMRIAISSKKNCTRIVSRNCTGLAETVKIWAFANEENWIPIGENIHGEEEDSRFGSSQSLNGQGDFVVIGAPDENEGYGKVFLYYRDLEKKERLQVNTTA